MEATSGKTRLALIGAGFIANVHFEVLQSRKDIEIVAVVDPALERAQAFAKKYGIPTAVRTVAELALEATVDAVHVMVPPEHHYAVAKTCLEAGYHCFVEKPIALSIEHARDLEALAKRTERVLAVNHNMTWQPNVRQLKADLAAQKIGSIEHVSIVHSVPLRQLDSGDVGHFMFRSEGNILFEQGVHLFSLVASLIGEAKAVRAVTAEPRRLANGNRFFDRWSVQIDAERASASVDMGFGRKFMAVGLEVYGTDGVARLDLIRGTYQVLRKSKWLEFYDHAQNTMRNGRRLFFQGVGIALDYGFSLFKIKGPTEPFLASMAGSIGAFHDAIRKGQPVECDGAQGEAVLQMCLMAAESAGADFEVPSAPEIGEPGEARPNEIVITGGTGFVGKKLIPELLEHGHSVTMLVRRPATLPECLRDRRIRYVQGDATDAAAMRRVLKGAATCVHMATCAGDDPARIEEAMRLAMHVVGDACLAESVDRLIFVSSTAALYLGGRQALAGDCGTDTEPMARPAYARGKIAAELALRSLSEQHGLKSVVLRPAIVVGEGGMMDHSGVGLWVRDNHCIGWGSGSVPLPFVLVADVARAIRQVVETAGLEGKAYNLAGDVRMSSVEYIDLLRKTTGRDLHFHPQPLWFMWSVEMGKWLVKFAARRKGQIQTMRDLKSRGFFAPLDCQDAKRDFDWDPVRDPEIFAKQAIEIWRSGQ